MTAEGLEFTGERYVPGITGNIELEHLHRYLQAAHVAGGKVVLDIACGEGYGSAILASKAEKVIGVDISPEAVKHARKQYRLPNVAYVVGSCENMPIDDGRIDLLVSFETIEHLEQHERMLEEIKRVLRADGVLIMSSPDKLHYSDLPAFKNPHHVKELYQQEFKKLIGNYFQHAAYFGQRVVYGSVIFTESSAEAMTYRKINGDVQHSSGIASPLFWIAIASDAELPKLPMGLFEEPVTSCELVRQKDGELMHAVNLLRQKDEHLSTAAELLRRRDENLAVAAQLLKQKDELLAQSVRIPWAHKLLRTARRLIGCHAK